MIISSSWKTQCMLVQSGSYISILNWTNTKWQRWSHTSLAVFFVFLCGELKIQVGLIKKKERSIRCWVTLHVTRGALVLAACTATHPAEDTLYTQLCDTHRGRVTSEKESVCLSKICQHIFINVQSALADSHERGFECRYKERTETHKQAVESYHWHPKCYLVAGVTLKRRKCQATFYLVWRLKHYTLIGILGPKDPG